MMLPPYLQNFHVVSLGMDTGYQHFFFLIPQNILMWSQSWKIIEQKHKVFVS